MPLHRNESSGQKTLNFKGNNQTCLVKENNHLSRERSTVMTIVSSANSIKTPAVEFVFKGTGKRAKVSPPGKISVQWAEKGSYRLEHVLAFIEKLPTIPTAFTPEKRIIFNLDDYSAHLPKEVEDALHKKGYFFIVIGGGITGDVQVNDTSYHQSVKSAYRDLEMELMLDLLKTDPTKIPTPTRDQMIEMFDKAWDKTCSDVDNEQAFKTNMMTLAFDGREDHLASRKPMHLVGDEMLKFRAELLQSKAPQTIKELRSTITKPEGVKYKRDEPPSDEGMELYDADEGIIEEEEIVADSAENDDELEVDISSNGQSMMDATSDNLVDEEQQITTVTTAPDTNDVPPSASAKNLKALDDINKLVSTVNESCSNELKPFHVQIQGITSNTRRKLLNDSKKVDGFVQDALARNCFDDCFSTWTFTLTFDVTGQ